MELILLFGSCGLIGKEIFNSVLKEVLPLAENLKIVVEPGGAVAASALLNNRLEIRNKTVIVMVSGGNIDNELFSQIVNNI